MGRERFVRADAGLPSPSCSCGRGDDGAVCFSVRGRPDGQLKPSFLWERLLLHSAGFQ